jgi:hypothetical protein
MAVHVADRGTGCDTGRMGIVYRIDPALDCTIVVRDGVITADDHVQHLLRLAADPDWPPARHLTDLTTVGEVTAPDPKLMDALVEGSPMRDDIAKVIIMRPGVPRRALDTGLRSVSRWRARGMYQRRGRVCPPGVDPTVMRSTLDELRLPLDSTRLVDPYR